MTRKDYEVVAEIVVAIENRDSLNGPHHASDPEKAGVMVARILREHYPNFNMIKFFRYLDKLESDSVNDL